MPPVLNLASAAILNQNPFFEMACSKDTGSRSGPTIDLREYNYLWHKHSQHLERDEWDPVKVGDKLVLIGTKSIFGFRVYAISN